MTTNELKKKIKESGLSVPKIAELTGMPDSSLYGIVNGTRGQHLTTLVKLEYFFKGWNGCVDEVKKTMNLIS